MRVTEHLIRNAQKKKQTNARAAWEEEEETLSYMIRKTRGAVNEEAGVFRNRLADGINTRESIFDRNAVFRTGNGRQEE